MNNNEEEIKQFIYDYISEDKKATFADYYHIFTELKKTDRKTYKEISAYKPYLNENIIKQLAYNLRERGML